MDRIGIEEIDRTCRELLHESSTVNNPEVTRALITAMLDMIEWFYRRNPSRQRCFQLFK